MTIKIYDRGKAVAYAHRWAFGRNPKYYNFDRLGGDCTNFISQVIFAGAGVMNYTPNYGWYYLGLNNRSPSWSAVEFLYRFLTKNKGPGPVAVETQAQHLQAGDIIQISFNGYSFQHTVVIVSAGHQASIDNILVAAHTDDSDNRSLDTYPYKRLRFLHITHVNTA